MTGRIRTETKTLAEAMQLLEMYEQRYTIKAFRITRHAKTSWQFGETQTIEQYHVLIILGALLPKEERLSIFLKLAPDKEA